jgi:hypothetical protein
VDVHVAVALLTTTVYVPVAAVVAFDMAGLCSGEVKPLGPVQAYVTPEVEEVALRFSVAPSQIGVLEDVVGTAGIWFTTTAVVAGAEVHPATVTVTV